MSRRSLAILRPSSTAACANGSVRSATATAVDSRSCNFKRTSINDATATSPSPRGRAKYAHAARPTSTAPASNANHIPRSPIAGHHRAATFAPTETTSSAAPAHSMNLAIARRNAPKTMRRRVRATSFNIGVMLLIGGMVCSFV